MKTEAEAMKEAVTLAGELIVRLRKIGIKERTLTRIVNALISGGPPVKENA
jgi:hypothetical protein